MVSGYWHTIKVNRILGWVTVVVSQFLLIVLRMRLNRGPLALLLRTQYEFPLGIDKVLFLIELILYTIYELIVLFVS